MKSFNEQVISTILVRDIRVLGGHFSHDSTWFHGDFPKWGSTNDPFLDGIFDEINQTPTSLLAFPPISVTHLCADGFEHRSQPQPHRAQGWKKVAYLRKHIGVGTVVVHRTREQWGDSPNRPTWKSKINEHPFDSASKRDGFTRNGDDTTKQALHEYWWKQPNFLALWVQKIDTWRHHILQNETKKTSHAKQNYGSYTSPKNRGAFVSAVPCWFFCYFPMSQPAGKTKLHHVTPESVQTRWLPLVLFYSQPKMLAE